MPASHLLQALYRINKAAKQYADDAAQAYQIDDGESARIASCRKTALYRFKTYLLQQWYAAGAVARVDQHTIAGRAYYCLTIDDWQFHVPVEQWETLATAFTTDEPDPAVIPAEVPTPPPPAVPAKLPAAALTETTTLDTFDADSRPTNTPNLSITEALETLDREFGASPNDFLDQSFIDVGWHRPNLRFTGWPSLSHARKPPTPPEEGDRVAYPELDEADQQKFLFAADETLETFDHGAVTIAERYGVYQIPFHSQSNWPIIVPTYDLRFIDEERTQTGVDQETLFGYHVLLADPTAPAETFKGRLADLVQDIDPSFKVGDTIHFTSSPEPEQTLEAATVAAFAAWELLIDCRLEYDDGTTRWEAYDDFAPYIEDG